MSDPTITELKKENATLRAKNKRLAGELADVLNDAPLPEAKQRWRTSLVALFVILSITLLFVSNILLWAGNTIAKTDKYVATVTPLVEDAAIQSAVAAYATQQIYNNVAVEPYIASVLPARATFLAPALATQLEKQTESTLKKVVASQKFKQVWVSAQTKAHRQFVTVATNYNGNGTIQLNDVYQYLSGELKGTPLAFMADKNLPSGVGNIQVAQVAWLPAAHKLVTHIDTWRVIAISLFAVTTAAAVIISKRRRRLAITLGLTYGGVMLLTLISIRIGKEVSAGQVATEYQEAVRHAYQIITKQLSAQTSVVMLAGFLMAVIAWISGPSKSAQTITVRINTLLAGNAHKALFTKENTATHWVGAHRRLLQWGCVAIIATIILFSRPTLLSLTVLAATMLVGVLIVELLAAPQQKQSTKQKRRI